MRAKNRMRITIHNLKSRENEALDRYSCTCPSVMNGLLLFIKPEIVEKLGLKNGDIVECEMVANRELTNIKIVK